MAAAAVVAHLADETPSPFAAKHAVTRAISGGMAPGKRSSARYSIILTNTSSLAQELENKH